MKIILKFACKVALLIRPYTPGIAGAIVLIIADRYMPLHMRYFLDRIWPGLKLFGIIYLSIAAVTALVYYKSLGAFFEDETPLTLQVQRFNIAVWICFWLCWSYYCADISLTVAAGTLDQVIIMLLAAMPGILMSAATIPVRRDEIMENEESKKSADRYGHKYEPYTLNTNYSGYVGFYGLVCIPAYLVLLSILHAYPQWCYAFH